jgi:diguanylate cyclase (GGDEF)-like protein
MGFDLKTVWIIGSLNEIFFGILLLVVCLQYPAYLRRALQLWSLSTLSLGSYYLIALSRESAGDFPFQVVGFSLVTLALALKVRAVVTLKKLSGQFLLVYIAPVLVLVSNFCFTFVYRNISIKLIIFNLVNCCLLFLLAHICLRGEDLLRHTADKLAAAGYLFMAVSVGIVAFLFLNMGSFPADYDMGAARSLWNVLTAVVAGAILSPLFLLQVSERLNRKFAALALRDPMTNLYNRRAFEEMAFREMAVSARSHSNFALFMLDIDHFKRINDEFGHAIGDQALIKVASTLRASLREEDFLCRWGGDEFCAFLPRADAYQAQIVVERVCAAIRAMPLTLDSICIELEVSVGIVPAESGMRDMAQMIQQADAAMYRAKAAGRNGYKFAGKGLTLN